ncbi:quinolinate synthase NadA [Tuwongella immobilis]|uniref:Quinolinate synthase n=1 Tax=Tuwongella immobilis TaxID=692036 RepID=A0A6C2YVM3_9BACT|nr:quinolinate synthase NadA [Tuwongella immobilis]VIP05798.1 quinolinate synthetase : Quinolinate synthase OS=Singulisphaera acidiphila (strain ATCC BAA-1392 / DSM 18658 / VKM B-2454 / MOB10) GN=Sinac_2813 PE=4 SV=1: NadA [Tuwongella immobilis]VTS08952.1 quinolinate synthetase : Quinolinate synthase OS=Singulisphaera acidiphila (strain ATCC BAA-1392 / DSM 18658 / VKM B-2454 / MOB10) GN=Sinac_2813 PE=4 SV=1: NadA [Tuwongella immobilis]
MATIQTPAHPYVDVVEEIQQLKKELDAVILAHYYQEGEIQEIADITGDSLKLAREATKTSASTIVFCGVHFMAETAKILNPEKRVLLPDVQAGCSLADSCPADKLSRYQEMLRINGRKFQTVTYINSTAAVKSLSDWIVTSGNAEEIIRRVPEEYEILFVPDQHLGSYLEEVTGRKMILWNGSCIVHEIFSIQDLLKAKKQYPDSLTIAHPECPANMREHADFIGGTEAMIKYVSGFAEPRDFLVATEANMLWQLQSKHPRHRYLPVPGIACACNKCPHMARNTLEKIRDCMKNGTPEIAWEADFLKARAALERSLLNPPPVASQPPHPQGD